MYEYRNYIIRTTFNKLKDKIKKVKGTSIKKVRTRLKAKGTRLKKAKGTS